MNLENYHQEAKIIDLMKANLVALKYFIVDKITFYCYYNNNLFGGVMDRDTYFLNAIKDPSSGQLIEKQKVPSFIVAP